MEHVESTTESFPQFVFHLSSFSDISSQAGSQTYFTRIGHEIPRTETEPKKIENRTEGNQFLFGSLFSGTERTEVNSVLYLGIPNLPKNTEFV
jgi:hypothetical protein